MNWRMLVMGLMATVGCASSAKPANTEPVASGAQDGVDDGAESPPPAPMSKSEQCEVLGEAIENGIDGGTKIVGFNDEAAIETLRSDWQAAVERIQAVESELPELAALRDDVAGLARKSADELAKVAEAPAEADKKAALARYRELTAELEGLVDRFNAICGS